MASIDIRNLVVGYGAATVIDNLSLNIPQGCFFTLLGPSGCGKTTLLRTIAGFAQVKSGSIHFDSKDVTQLAAHLRDVGMVFQDYALFPDKSVFDNVAYGLRARNKGETEIKKSVGEYLERVGLSNFAQRVPAALSGGQRQRVALARALVIHPSVLLMDEPLSNLDAKLRVQVRETIADLQKQVGITTVLVTHDQEEALVLSDQIGLLREGKLEQVGSPSALYELPASSYVADFVGAANVINCRLSNSVSAATHSSVTLGTQSSIQAFAPSALPSGEAKLIVRAEHLTLTNTPHSSNSLPCTVLGAIYLGPQWIYKIKLASGDLLAVTTPTDQGGGPQFTQGSQAYVRFDPARSLILEH